MIRDGMVMERYMSRFFVISAYRMAAEDSATLATSCPVAMKSAVMPLAECAPLLLAPLMKAPTLATP
jgi:hypothetical protein